MWKEYFVGQFKLLHRNFGGRTGQKRGGTLSGNHSYFEEKGNSKSSQSAANSQSVFWRPSPPPHFLLTVHCTRRHVGASSVGERFPLVSNVVVCVCVCVSSTHNVYT